MKRPGNGQLRSGLHTIRTRKLRSFWTMFGVIVGVASVITVIGLGQGVKLQISGQIHHLGKDIITVQPAQLHAGSSGVSNKSDLLSGFNLSQPLSLADLSAVATTKGVSASAPLTIVSTSVSGENGAYNDGFVIGTTPDLPSLLNQSLAYGSFLGDSDMGTNSVVLGSQASNELFNEDVPLGHSLTIHGKTFIVQGIFNQFSSLPFSQQINLNNAVFIPNDVAESLTDNTAPTYEILARATDSGQTAQLTKTIKHSLDAVHGGQSNFTVTTGSQNITSSNQVLGLLTDLIAGVAAISLLVGGVGIMNVMLVSVSERTHEIGIRKAVGATNRQILGQFMFESALLSLAGGIIGIAVAYVIDGAVRLTTDLQPSIDWQIVVLATAVSLAVGIVFGTIPAAKAAKKDPIDALRSE